MEDMTIYEGINDQYASEIGGSTNTVSLEATAGNEPTILGVDYAKETTITLKESETEISQENRDSCDVTLKPGVIEKMPIFDQQDFTAPLRPIENEDGTETELFKTEVTVAVDPNTGMYLPIEPGKITGQVDGTLDDIDNEELFDTTVSENNIDTLKEFDLNDEEAKQMMDLVLDYQKGNNKSLYSRLPNKIKGAVGAISTTRNIAELNHNAKQMIEYFMGQMKIDQGYMDLQSAIEKEIGSLDNIGDMYKEYDNQRMDETMLTLAEKYKESNPEKSETFLKLREIYLDAKSFTTIKKVLEDNSKDVKRLDKGVKQYDKLCRDFDYKYKNSKFNINSIKLVAKAIDRHLDGKYTEDDILKFTVLFCRICLNKKADDVYDHTFMFYTIKTILMLDILKVDMPFYQEIKSNLEHILDSIKLKGGK